MLTALLVVGILVFLIVVHEFGHFLAAKLFRVRVEEFGIGYPPRAFLFGRLGDTDYTLNWLPFGGFVKLFGETSGAEGAGRPKSFANAPRVVQAVILVAGVAMNALAAWLLFAGALSAGIPRPVEVPGAGTRLVVSTVVAGSPAQASGLSAGDVVTRVFDEGGAEPILTPSAMTEFVSERGGKEITVFYERGGEEVVAVMRPAHAVIPEAEGRPAVGLGLALVSEEPLPFPQALKEAGPHTFSALKTVVSGLWSLAATSLRGEGSLDDVVGPIGLIGVVGDASRHGFGAVLALAGFISVNLCIVNLIPIPALDGGRLVLVGIEAATRRPARHVAVQLLNFAGILAIAALMLAVTWNDIGRLLS